MPSNAILTLADDLTHHRLAESDLPDVTARLPALDEPTLHYLIRQADSASRSQPRYGWAIMAVMNAAANHTSSPFLQALVAWDLGRLANEYAHPNRHETPWPMLVTSSPNSTNRVG